MILYILCFILFLVGLYGLLISRNIIKMIISLTIVEFSIFLMLILIGYISGGIAPVVFGQAVAENQVIVDPLPQAMVLTAIVIALATNAMILTMAIRLYKKYGTFDIHEINKLKG
ncbi:MAG: cation:proton antiporter [Bacteroidetes bacterium]|nr:MAG: cation:proton antiporter [Bacteroidota bacterium]